MPFELVIWDCDGCLIDSEMLACGAFADVLRPLGCSMTAHMVAERFAGKGIRHIIRLLEEETGRDFAGRFPFEELDRKRKQLFEAQLQAMPHIGFALDSIVLPQCVASGSELDRLYHSLNVAGLYDRFEGRIFSAAQVEKGKPAPDLFLFAAEQMNVAPDKCLVIEDGVAGVQGGKAAGMTVFGYMGGSHITDAWRDRVTEAGVDLLFDDMRDLPRLMEQYFA
jgi:HAD superfamily hydrolase (TIGR01509 family)